MTLEGGEAGGKRGVSTVVAVVLLIGIVTVGIAVVLLSGASAVNDLESQSDQQIAEETMYKVDSVFKQSDESGKSFDISDEVDSDVSLNRQASYNITLNGNTKCSFDQDRDLGTIKHDGGDTITAYEAGGVWKMTPSGAVMSAPPDLTYNNGSLSVSFANISGDLSSSGDLNAQSNVTAETREQRKIVDELYRTSPCSAADVEKATVHINGSTFARAWVDWAESNYDEDLVDVSVEGGAPAERGDNVSITFKLGDVSDPYYDVRDLSVTRSSPTSDLDVSATVVNTGGLEGDKDVIYEYKGTKQATKSSLELEGGEKTRVSFTQSVSSGGKATFKVSSDGYAKKELMFTGPNVVPDLEFSANNIPNGTSPGSSVNAKIWVENTGGMTTTDTVILEIEGTGERYRYDVTLDPGENKSIDISDAMPVDRQGKNGLKFSFDKDPSTTVEYLEVANPGYFEVVSYSQPTPDAGEEANFNGKVKNIGNRTLTGTVELELRNLDTGITLGTYAQSVTLKEGNNTTVGTLSQTFSSGNYSFVVTTPNSSAGHTFATTRSGSSVYKVESLTVNKNPIEQEETIRVAAEIRNTGTVSGDRNVTLVDEDGNVLTSEQVTLDPQDRTVVSYQSRIANNSNLFKRGTNQVTVEVEDGTSISRSFTVEKPAETIEQSGGNGDAEFLQFNEEATVEIVAAGAELESNYIPVDEWKRVWNGNRYVWEPESYEDYGVEGEAPVRVRAFVENDSGETEIPLWRDEKRGDLNHPLAEKRMANDSFENIYRKELTLNEGSKLAVWATSYKCDGSSQSQYNHTRENNSQEYPVIAYTCDDWNKTSDGDLKPWIQISDAQNSSNAVILENGEPAPAFEQASIFQLGLPSMLDTVNASINQSGNLQMAEDQYIFQYELSKNDSVPSNASQIGDPDYNDAVMSVKVISTDQQSEAPAFNFTGVNSPAVSDGSTNETVTLTINNTGNLEGDAIVRAQFDNGIIYQDTVKNIDANDEATVTFDLPTKLASDGPHDWSATVSAARDELVDDSTAGQLTINPASGQPVYQVTTVSANGNEFEVNSGSWDTDDSETIDVTVEVTNIGGASGTDRPVNFTYQNRNTGDSGIQTQTLDLAAGESAQITDEFTIPADKTGTITYSASTPDSNFPEQTLVVGQSDLRPVSLNIGSSDYAAGSDFNRRGSVSQINVRVENEGAVKENRREVELELTNSTGYTWTYTKETQIVQSGGLTTAQYPLGTSLATDEVYDYEVTVYNDTSGDGGVERTRSGEMFLRAVPDGVDSTEDSPVDIDQEIINVTTG